MSRGRGLVPPSRRFARIKALRRSSSTHLDPRALREIKKTIVRLAPRAVSSAPTHGVPPEISVVSRNTRKPSFSSASWICCACDKSSRL